MFKACEANSNQNISHFQRPKHISIATNSKKTLHQLTIHKIISQPLKNF